MVSPPAKPNGNGLNGNHVLPRWFALKGPRPYWLAEHWNFILAITTGALVLLNTIVTMPGIDLIAEKWINAVLAWVAAGALILKDRLPMVRRVAAWREKIRAEEEAKKQPKKRARKKPPLLPDPDELEKPAAEPELPYRAHRVDPAPESEQDGGE